MSIPAAYRRGRAPATASVACSDGVHRPSRSCRELLASGREWFRRSFAEPTRAQQLGWPAIAAGKHTLILAPTGSGKTLAAFLSAIDGLTQRPSDGTQVLYVSPLKALNHDIEKNLRAPLAGIASERDITWRYAPATPPSASGPPCAGTRPTS